MLKLLDFSIIINLTWFEQFRFLPPEKMTVRDICKFYGKKRYFFRKVWKRMAELIKLKKRSNIIEKQREREKGREEEGEERRSGKGFRFVNKSLNLCLHKYISHKVYSTLWNEAKKGMISSLFSASSLEWFDKFNR